MKSSLFESWIIKEWKSRKRFSGDLPINQEKKTPIPYIYNASNKDPF